MFDKNVVFLNGDYIPWAQARVHVLSHSLSRGSAIFEVLSIHNTVKGPAVFRLDEHMERFFASARLLEMELPMGADDLQQATIETVRRNGLKEGYVKIVGFYPQIVFEILPPQKRLDLAVFAMDPEHDLGEFHFPVEKTASLCISQWRKLDPQTVPIEAKVAANYLNGMMAQMEAKKRGFEIAVMLDSQGFIAEGGTESIFLVKDGRLLAPLPGTILKSITRKSILEIARVLGIETQEGRLTPEMCLQADEIFLSGTAGKVLPVHKVEEREILNVPGLVSKKLSAMIGQIERGQEPRFQNWLFAVR